MNKILLGVTGTTTYENKTKIKDFIHKLKQQTEDQIVIVGLGDLYGADKYIKKYALELGYTYCEMNAPHTTKNLYSLMSEAYYEKPYSHKNMFLRNKIYCQYIDKCILFDDSNEADKKVKVLIKELAKTQKKAIILGS